MQETFIILTLMSFSHSLVKILDSQHQRIIGNSNPAETDGAAMSFSHWLSSKPGTLFHMFALTAIRILIMTVAYYIIQRWQNFVRNHTIENRVEVLHFFRCLSSWIVVVDALQPFLDLGLQDVLPRTIPIHWSRRVRFVYLEFCYPVYAAGF